jgi:hypothetical protein
MNFDLHSRLSVIPIHSNGFEQSLHTSIQAYCVLYLFFFNFYLATLSVAQTIMGTPGEDTSVGGVRCEEIHATLCAENVTPLTGTLVERNQNKRCARAESLH